MVARRSGTVQNRTHGTILCPVDNSPAFPCKEIDPPGLVDVRLTTESHLRGIGHPTLNRLLTDDTEYGEICAILIFHKQMFSLLFDADLNRSADTILFWQVNWIFAPSCAYRWSLLTEY